MANEAVDKREVIRKAVAELEKAIRDFESDGKFIVSDVTVERSDTFDGQNHFDGMKLRMESLDNYLWTKYHNHFI